MQTFHSHTGDETAACIEEIRQLRQRVTVLESALANAEAAVRNQNPSVSTSPPVTSISFTPATPDPTVVILAEAPSPAVLPAPPLPPAPLRTPAAIAAAVGTEFEDDETKLVSTQSMFRSPDAPAVAAADPADTADDASFAAAWNDDESFEEKLAQRAFFEAGVVDEQSRSWLLNT